MEQNHTQNLTQGSPLKLLIGFILPLLFGLLFQQFYTMIDTIVVGKFLGVDALAGVGSTGAINFLILGFCMGICSGFSIPVAHKFGMQDYQGLRRIVGNMIWWGIAVAAVMTLGITLFLRPILTVMHTPEETFSYAYTYALIVFLGIPAAILYNLLSGIIRSLGDSKTPLYFLIFSSILNIVLDLLLILLIPLGVAGAAIATVVSQLIAGILCLIFMCRRFPILKLSRDDRKLRKAESMQLLSMGIPMGLQYSITAIGCTILQVAVNHLGPAAMAATTASGRAFGLMSCPYEAIGTAAAIFSGQNVGAGKFNRVNQGTLANFFIGSLYFLLALLLVYFFGEPFLMLFLDSSAPNLEEILRLGHQQLMYSTVFLIPLLCVNLFRFSIQGMGYSNAAMIAGVLELVGRAALAMALVPVLGFTAVCLANPAAWILADLFLIPMYFYGLHKLKKHHAQSEL